MGHFYPYAATPSGVEEVDRNHKVVWSYTSKAPEVWVVSESPTAMRFSAKKGRAPRWKSIRCTRSRDRSR